MESTAILLDPVPPPDGSAAPKCTLASVRRRAWAKSRESTWQDTQKVQTFESQQKCPHEALPDCSESNGAPKKTSEEPGPNKITCWLDQCRTPLAVSLDDQSAPACKGAARNGCSFEDDLSLGAEADHLQSIDRKAGSRGSLAADQKRGQYKEKGRSMNSTGSGKSSTVSSVSELLDLYEEDPEEILLNLGFGRDEPDMSSKIPSRFFNGSSAARGIDIKVYLGAQLQRMELENPNYALTSRFRQIEVLTTVANQFIQLYGHVSGQPVQNVGGRDRGGEVVKDPGAPSLFQRTKSAQNVADRLKKSLSKHNLLTASPGRPAEGAPPAPAEARDLADGDARPADKHVRKKDGCSLATVAEEGEKERRARPRQNAGQSADDPRAPEKALGPTLLAQLRTENADSFDMEEIQSNEGEALLSRTSRSSDLLRTTSQQSDSSGFAEETTSPDAAGNLKVQESSDSCDSETTVTSHPSQDVTTPVALNQPAFDLPDVRTEESPPPAPRAGAAARETESSRKREDDGEGHEESEPVPQYKAHQLPKNLAARHDAPEPQQDPKQEDARASQDDAQKDPPPSEPSDPPPSDPPPSEPSDPPPSEPPPSEPSDPPPSEPPPSEPSPSEPSDPPPSEPSDPPPSDPPPSEPPPSELSHSPSSCPAPSAHGSGLQAAAARAHPFRLPASDSPVLSALSRVKRRLGDAGPRSSRRCPRSGLPLQRSSSLPSSLPSPTRVVSSVKVQLGPDRAFSSQPRYAFRYVQEPDDEPERADSPARISTLVIQNAATSDDRAAAAAPRPLDRLSRLLRCASPPAEVPWISQSVPDLSSSREPLGHRRQGGTSLPGQDIFHSPNPSPRPQTPLSAPALNPSLLYSTPPHPYASLPNILQPYSNHFTFTPPPLATPPHYASLWNLPLGTPPMHPYHAGTYHTAHPFVAQPYLGYHGYDPSPFHPLAPDPAAHWGGGLPGQGQSPGPYHGIGNSSNPYPNLGQSPHPGVGQGHGPYPGVVNGPHLGHGLAHSPYLGVGPGTYPGLGPGLSPGNGLHLGSSPGSGQVLSGTEMQLRRVLHDIRGTVHNLNQQRVNASDVRAEAPRRQDLDELRQKRRSLAAFRTRMLQLELSLVRQQALVYNHLSPADRLEVEQLESLRSAVRDELLALEQQLEDKLMELTQDAGPPKGVGTDEASASSALRAVEPVSDLLKEQFLLQSELSDDRHAASSAPPLSPGPGAGGPAVYRASINITPVPPPRPDGRRDEEGAGGEEEAPGAGRGDGDALRRLIAEVGESVTQEEILKEPSAPNGAPQL